LRKYKNSTHEERGNPMESFIVEGKYLVTMDSERRVIENGAVVVEGNSIIDVGKSSEMKKTHSVDRVLGGRKCMIIPGFVDVHSHVFQCLLRGIGDDLPVEAWVDKSVFPMAKATTKEDFYWAAKLNALEMIKSGTTTFADSHYIHIDKHAIDRVADGTLESGIRSIMVRASQNAFDPAEFLEDVATAKKETRRIFAKYNGREGRMLVLPEILKPIEADENFIIEMKALADELGNGLHMHVAETLDELKLIKNRTGLGEIEYLEKLGVLDSNLLMAHIVWASKKEILSIKRADAKIAHNPVSNQYLADGVADVPLMRSLGITVGIGCDGASSNNDQDMIKAMKMCALMHKNYTLDASVITAEDVMEMATIDGARALRMEDTIGSIERGKKADLAVIDLNKPHLTPCPRPISNLVYSANGSDVITTIVDGKILMEDRVVCSLDEQMILDRVDEITKDLIEKSGIQPLIDKGKFHRF
jgi:5-methylthioadenosine/S-adenosylhomocysteine deaminase